MERVGEKKVWGEGVQIFRANGVNLPLLDIYRINYI